MNACASQLLTELENGFERNDIDEAIRGLCPDELQFLFHYWPLWAREDQLPPDGGWTTWLILAGRGAGKTRAGAEWVRSRAQDQAEPRRIALIAETMADARDVMVEGISGLLKIHGHREKPRFQPSLRRLVWPNGSVAQLFSAEDPDSLRGHQFHAAWCDEMAKWRYPQETWDMLQFGLRLGDHPRQVITTTPRPIPLLKDLLEQENVVVSKADTYANSDNLPAVFIESVLARYKGTRLGRQEIEAEILHDNPRALWRRDQLDKLRISKHPPLGRIVIAVDPPASSGPKADACGIIAAGLAEDGRAIVIEDATVQGFTPRQWAKRAVAIYHKYGADCLIAETNQGGEMVRDVLTQIDDTLSYRPVRAKRGKWLRAEPVAMLYEQGRISHCGSLSELEDEMCEFEPEGLSNGRSPDRVDALVWALTELMLSHAKPRVRSF